MKEKNSVGKSIKTNWRATPTEARKIQENIRGELRQTPLTKPVRFIAGADVSFNKFEKDVYAGIIVLSYPDLQLVEYACIRMEVSFPYIPGLLSFREIPPLLEVWKRLTVVPDILMVDGHGIAHPRRLGIAAHFGLEIGMPTMGAAKSILYGTYEEPPTEAGSYTYIVDPKTIDENKAGEKKTSEKIGLVVRTKNKVKPMFISPGHLCSMDDALKIALETVRGYRLPEPTRQAHNLVNKFRTGELPSDVFNYWKAAGNGGKTEAGTSKIVTPPLFN